MTVTNSLIMISSFITFCYIVHFAYNTGYKEGYRNGGNMVLSEWKRSMNKIGDGDRDGEI